MEIANNPNTQDLRGRMVRSDRQMSDTDTRSFLREHSLAHVGTTDAAGWPYVVALMYVYEQGDLLYLHTGPHQGHFLANVRKNPRLCVHVDAQGALQRGQPSPCNSALGYKSAVAYGEVRILESGPGVDEKKTWFLDCLMERLNEPMSAYQKPGYPMLNSIILFEVALEIVTGKINVGMHH